MQYRFGSLVLLVCFLAASNATVNCVIGKPLFPDIAFTATAVTSAQTGAGKGIGVSSVGFIRAFISPNAPAVSIFYTGIVGSSETLLGNSSGIHYSLIPGTTVVFGGDIVILDGLPAYPSYVTSRTITPYSVIYGLQFVDGTYGYISINVDSRAGVNVTAIAHATSSSDTVVASYSCPSTTPTPTPTHTPTATPTPKNTNSNTNSQPQRK